MNVDCSARVVLAVLSSVAIAACDAQLESTPAGPALDPNPSAEDVALGRDWAPQARVVAVDPAPADIDLGKCLAADCTPGDGERPELRAVPQTCDTGRWRPLTDVWIESFIAPLDPSCDQVSNPCSADPSLVQCDGVGDCSFDRFEIALAPDQSLWVAANFTGPGHATQVGGVMLAHYAPNGTVLSKSIVESKRVDQHHDVWYSADLSVDPRGSVFLSVIETLSEQGSTAYDYASWLAVYDENGAPTGTRVVFRGADPNANYALRAPTTLPTSAGTIVVAQPQVTQGPLALLQADDLAVRWVQPRSRRLGLEFLAADAQGRIAVMTRSPDGGDSGRVEQYSADGSLNWERTLPWRSRRADFFGSLAIDRRGNLVQASISSGDSQSATPELWVETINPGGETVSRLRVTSPMSDGYLTKSVDPEPTFDHAGRAFVPGGMYQEYPQSGDMPLPRLQLYELSRDGSRCHLYGWPTAMHQVEHVIVTADDRFYFAGRTGFGRLQR